MRPASSLGLLPPAVAARALALRDHELAVEDEQLLQRHRRDRASVSW